MTKIEGSMYVDGRPTLNGRIECPEVQKVISGVSCREFCCPNFEASQSKKGGKFDVWCNYEPPKFGEIQE